MTNRPALPLAVTYSTWDERGEREGVLYERLGLALLVGVTKGKRVVEKYETPWIETRPMATACRPQVVVAHNGSNAYFRAGCWLHLSGTRVSDHNVAMTLARKHVMHAETAQDPFLWRLESVDEWEARVTGKEMFR